MYTILVPEMSKLWDMVRPEESAGRVSLCLSERHVLEDARMHRV